MTEFLDIKKQKPVTGQLCMVSCPGWNQIGLVLAVYTGKKFEFPDNNFPNFKAFVKGYKPLKSDGSVDHWAILKHLAKLNSQHSKNNVNAQLTNTRPLNDQKALARGFGFITGVLSKFALEYGGCNVDYKINGESIEKIRDLTEFDLTDRLKLAISESRFEDAAIFRDQLKSLNLNQNQLNHKSTPKKN